MERFIRPLVYFLFYILTILFSPFQMSKKGKDLSFYRFYIQYMKGRYVPVWYNEKIKQIYPTWKLFFDYLYRW